MGVSILGFFLVLQGATASEWSRSLQASGAMAGELVAATSDGGALVVASSVQGPVLARMSPDGTLRWSLVHGATRSGAAGLLRLPGDESLLVGSTEVPPSTTNGWIARLDADGVSMWDRTILSTSTVGLHDADLLVSGEVVVAGWQGAPAVSARPVVLGLDPAGSLNWQLALDGAPFNRVGVAASRDGGFVLASGFQGDGFVAKFDASRRVEWQLRIGDSSSNFFTDAVQVDDGGFVLRGFTSTPGMNGTWLVKLTAAGDLAWSAALGGAPGVGAYGVSPCPDQGLLVSGGANGGPWGRISKVDAAGNLEWTVEHGSADSRGHGMALAPDGGIYFVGADRAPFPLEWAAWLLKLDARGLDPSACSSSAITAQSAWPPMNVIDTTHAVLDPGLTMEPTAGIATVRDVLAVQPRCPPAEVTGLRVRCTLAGATLTWDPALDAVEYEVYRGTLPPVMPLVYDHADVGACAIPSTTWTDPGACLDGGDWYYLVIGRNSAGRGPYGTNSLGAATPPAAPECP